MQEREMKKKALITGINGMDGSHLADMLVQKGYDVYGLERRTTIRERRNTRHLEGHVRFIVGDITDRNSLFKALEISQPDEVYNLAAQSYVGDSWTLAEQTTKVNSLGTLHLLECVRDFDRRIRFYQASSSEMFGKVATDPQDEYTPFYPRSPYGVSKLYAHWITKNFRESYDMYACAGILFNHESERRGIEFVTRKITDSVAKIALGLKDKIALGNLEAKRDWGYAPDYVEAMWLMLQQEEDKFFSEKRGEFVIATGKCLSVRDFLSCAFDCIGVSDWEKHVVHDQAFVRPNEVDTLRGDPSKAKDLLGWEPKTSFMELVKRMVENDKELLRSKT